MLGHMTRVSGLSMASGMDHVISCDSEVEQLTQSEDDLGRVTLSVELQPGEKLRLVKFVSYHWSSQQSVEWLRDQVDASLESAIAEGFDGLVEEQRDILDGYWERADIEVDGDEELQQALRFAMFHMFQAAARNEGRAIPAKGLTGRGYDGHAFWDTESFVLPLLTFTAPATVRHALMWRHSTLEQARDRAEQLHLRGAAFPWRTIHGEECSGYWPAGTAAFHVNADIADAVRRYVLITGDDEFEERYGCELLVETARLWESLGHHDDYGAFRIDGVTGPDEYSALVDNNVYTNLMAQLNLESAYRATGRHAEAAKRLGVDEEERQAWKRAADAMFVPFDEQAGIHPQDDSFLHHQRWDFENTPEENYPLLLHYPYFQLYREQVVKQADLVLAMQLRGDAFTPEQKLAQLRLLRAADRARLVAVGGDPGGDRRRGRPPRARERLPLRGVAHGHRRPRAQHRRRPAHGVARGRGDRDGRRLRRAARAGRQAAVQPAPAGGHRPALPTRSSCAARCCASRSWARRRPTACERGPGVHLDALGRGRRPDRQARRDAADPAGARPADAPRSRPAASQAAAARASRSSTSRSRRSRSTTGPSPVRWTPGWQRRQRRSRRVPSATSRRWSRFRRRRATSRAPRSASRWSGRWRRRRPQIERRQCSSPGHADDLVLRLRGSGERRLLLLGHLDTVIGHDSHRPLERDGDRLVGSGHGRHEGRRRARARRLRALAARTSDFAEVALLLVTDEEWRSAPFAHVEAFAGWDACLCFEAGQRTPDGDEAVIVRRKAAATLRVRAAGRSAHSGAAPERGRNALLALAAAAQAIAGANDPGGADELTAVPTIIRSGDAFNVVPGDGELFCDLRSEPHGRLRRGPRAAARARSAERG